LRPIGTGNSVRSRAFNSARTSARSVCRIGVSADTLTVSVSCPTSSFASTRATEFIETGTLRRLSGRNPVIVTETEYVPGGTAVK
jgi:hypothetical protein